MSILRWVITRWMLVELALKLIDGHVVPSEFAALRNSAKLSDNDLFDALAKEIALKFSEGTWSLEDSDAAINHLFAFHMSDGSSKASTFFHSVFLAFDDGEHDHFCATGGRNPAELYTRPALARILGST